MSNIQVDINPNNFKWALLREDRNGGYSDVSFYRTRKETRHYYNRFKKSKVFKYTVCKVYKNSCGNSTFEKSW